MNPRAEALRFRIWQYAAPLEWNVTCREIAEAMGVSFGSVRQILRYTGWHNRVRVGSTHSSQRQHFEGAGNSNLAAHIAAEVVAGRISSEAAI